MESIYQIDSPEVRQTLQEERTDVLVKHEKFLIENAFRVHFRMSVEQLILLQSCFVDRLVISDKALKESSHPILAGLNQYANLYIANAIKILIAQGITCITFGDRAHGPLGSCHNCLLIDDDEEGITSPREYQRIGLNPKAPANMHNYVRGRAKKFTGCGRGGQKCYEQAQQGFSSHALYDVTMEQLCRMFNNHNMDKLTAFLHISTRLYGDDYVDPFPFFKVELGKDFVIFNMCDTSIPYVHRLDTYMAWAKTTIVKYKHFDLVFEHARTYGPMHMIVVTRVKHTERSPLRTLLNRMMHSFELNSDAVRMTVPLGSIFKGAYLVPDLHHALVNKYLYPQKSTKHHVVPANIVVALYAYANRAADEGYKYHELATYASGLRRRIVIGGVKYQTDWDCDANTYNRVVFSLFILGALARTERTKGISAIFQHLKSTGMESSFLGELFRSVRRFFHTQVKDAPNTMGERIWDFKVIPIEDISICNIVNVSNGDDLYQPILSRSIKGLEDCDDEVVNADSDDDSHDDGTGTVRFDMPTNDALSSDSSDTFSIASCNSTVSVPTRHGASTPLPCSFISNPVFDPNGSVSSGTLIDVDAASTSVLSFDGPVDHPADNERAREHGLLTQLEELTIPEHTVVDDDQAATPVDKPVHRTPFERVVHTMLSDHKYGPMPSNASTFAIEPTSAVPPAKDGKLIVPCDKEDSQDGQKPPPPTFCSIDEATLAVPPAKDGEPKTPCDKEVSQDGQKPTMPPILGGNTFTPCDKKVSRDGNKPASPHANDDDKLYNQYFVDSVRILPKKTLDDQTKGLPKYRSQNYKELTINEAHRYKKYYRSDRLNYVAGNLFNAPKDVPLAHCVGADFIMGGGIAATFKNVYNSVDKLLAQKKGPGENAILRADRRIYYMVTKSRTSEKPSYQALERCLDNLFEDCMKNGFKRIGIPKIACGIDGLEWGIVAAMISEKFYGYIDVDVYDPALTRIASIPRPSASTHNIDINGDTAEAPSGDKPGLVNGVMRTLSKTIGNITSRNTGWFKAGHCAMEAFYMIMPADRRPPVTEYLAICRALLSERKMGVFTDDDINDYIDRGVYDNNCSATIIPLLSSWFSVPIRLNVDGTDSPKFVYHSNVEGIPFDPNGKCDVIFYANQHYSHRRGGVVQKFDQVPIIFNLADKEVLDISGAPGYLADVLIRAGAEVDVGYYLPSPIKYTYQHKTYGYNNFAELFQQIENHRYDFIFSDVARAVNSEAIIYEAASMFVPLLKTGGTFVVKTFGNPHSVWEMASVFQSIRLLPFSSGPTERYFALEGYRQGSVNFRDIYDAYNIDVTSHTAYHVDVERFAREFFTKEFKAFAPTVIPPHPPMFGFKALTGYASAAKTTRAVDMFKNSVWISPTKPLSMKHQKMGVPSFTPHTFFAKPKDEFTTIVVDEISQFPIDYLSMLKTCYPSHEIVVLGDVYQTGMVNLRDKRKLQTVKDIGVINNLLDVFKIPQDIAAMLNKRHFFNISTKSEVVNGLCTFGGDIFEFAKSFIPVICFNAETCKKLRAKHLNAYTITTYTGSRDHTVVLYIDSAAIQSSLINRTEQIYTAVTRATNRLVVAGDHSYLTKYYEVHGTNMMTFEEISQAYIFHHNIQEDDTVLPVAASVGKTSLPVSSDVALATIANAIRPVNDQLNEDFSTGTTNVPPVETGTLIVPEDVVVAVEEEVVGYRISFLRAAKHQSSSCSLETLQTLVKRYSRKFKVRLDNRNVTYAFNELVNGLSMALTGSPNNINKIRKMYRITPEELVVRQAAYIDKLEQKIKHNPGVAKELQGEYDLAKEALSFFNKRQTKFDPVDGFDMKDKVGQGVAAFSKKVNAAYSAYARMMLDKTREIIAKGNRNIILATHDSEAALNDMYTNMTNQFSGGLWSCNDFSEWDASFRTPFTKITSMLLEFMGAPTDLITDFENYRKNWTMIYRSEHGLTKLKGFEKQFSGNPFTICENTICNMALCFTIFDYTNMKMAMFKGDDSAVLCGMCKLTTKGESIIRLTGHGLKMHNSHVGEFAGWFLTKEGMFPDVLRYAGKFVDKVYRDEEHFNDALMSLQERVVAVKNEVQLNEGIAACHYYYKTFFGEERLTFGDVANLYYFIHGSRKIKFDTLRPVKLPIRKA